MGDGSFVGVIRNKDFSITEPINRDFSFDQKKKYLDDEFVSLSDVRKKETKEPESGWFFYFLSMIIAYLKCLNSIAIIHKP